MATRLDLKGEFYLCRRELGRTTRCIAFDDTHLRFPFIALHRRNHASQRMLGEMLLIRSFGGSSIVLVTGQDSLDRRLSRLTSAFALFPHFSH